MIDNITSDGELPFAETVYYLQNADIALNTLNLNNRIASLESFNNSLKVIQYTYCQLPIIVSSSIYYSKTNFFHYESGNSSSIKTALRVVKIHDRKQNKTDSIYD